MAGGFVLGAEQGPSHAALVPERRFYTQSAWPTAAKTCLRRHVASPCRVGRSRRLSRLPELLHLLATEAQGMSDAERTAFAGRLEEALQHRPGDGKRD